MQGEDVAARGRILLFSFGKSVDNSQVSVCSLFFEVNSLMCLNLFASLHDQ